MSSWRGRFVIVTLGAVALCSAFQRSVSSQAQFKASVRTVPLYVTVSDSSGKPIRDLEVGDFQVEDDGRKQTITVFKNDIQPVTMAILLDRSPSLFPTAARAAEAVVEFTRAMIPGDRATVGTFSQSVQLSAVLSQQPEVLLESLQAVTPWPAGTAIWDAVEAGRSALDAEGGKRVIMLVTDGADNASRADPNVVRIGLQKSGIIVYAVGIRGRVGLDTTEIGALANSTGGRSLELKSSDDIGVAMRQVAEELHNQYLIGFSPGKLDDKLHRIVVKVRRPGAVARTTRMYFAAR